MKLTLYSIGKFGKHDPQQALFNEYQKRLPWEFTLKELAAEPATPVAEAKLLEQAFSEADFVIAFDGSGKPLSSSDLAEKLDFIMQTKRHIGLLIGGADGLTREMVNRADLVLSLGAMTWPHKLVRVMLAEQFYRASAILSGHPYHK